MLDGGQQAMLARRQPRKAPPMSTDVQTQLALLLITALFVGLWRLAGRHPLPPTALGMLQRATQRRTALGSAEITRRTEREQPQHRLPFELGRTALWATRACLLALYLLALLATLGR